MKTKSWARLKKEVEASKISALVCDQTFEETKADSKTDNPQLNGKDWKADVMFRILQENLYYWGFTETMEEDVDNELHQRRMEVRNRACDFAAWKWVAIDQGVDSIVEAQAEVDKFLAEIEQG